MNRFLLVDTGGLLGRTHEWSQDIHKQALSAISEADVIIYLLGIFFESFCISFVFVRSFDVDNVLFKLFVLKRLDRKDSTR
jgi:hypothetical protein